MNDITSKYKNLEILVYEEIKSMIFQQKLPPNSKIVEEEISKQLNVSRTPIRAALTALVKDGLVKIIPRRGAYVVSIDVKDIEEIYMLREVLEGIAARYSTKNADKKFLSELKKALDNYRVSAENKSSDGCFKFDEIFHHLIHVASGNNRLLYHTEILKNQIQLLKFRSSNIPGRPLKSLEEHIKVFNAIKDKDPDMSELAMREHIRNAKEDLLKFYKGEIG
ncbi:MAG: GntR family transcriptional regulator [Dictyoglomi bacterium]|nr:GntR family transcriptional regulator [Dictyoglomota bacterium]